MQDFQAQLEPIISTALTGSVVQTAGMTAGVADFPAPVGSSVEIERVSGKAISAEVVGFRGDQTIVFPLGKMEGVRHGSQVRLKKSSRTLAVGPGMLGRLVDATGQVIDGGQRPVLNHRVPLDASPPPASSRPRIDSPLGTGIRAIDGLLTCGRGQRIGIFSGSGVGKSVLLGMMARHTAADVNVIAMVGERGREVNEFIARDLGSDGLAKSVVVVATSDQPALMRVRCALAATAIAEYFRDSGKEVLLMMDSVTRFAMAQREIGLSAGEPPTTRGYPPSVFAMLPPLVERAGRSESGSITALYTVLVEGDDTNEPVSDTVRGLLDGHILLSRKLASMGHYPAIDVLQSISRLFQEVVPDEHYQAVRKLRSLMAVYQENEDMITIGAYRQGSNPQLDRAIAMRNEINQLLQQGINEVCTSEAARQAVLALAAKAGT